MKKKHMMAFAVLALITCSIIVFLVSPFDDVMSEAGNAKTITTTIYATLISILLALLALAVTAYIFLAGSLKEQQKPYEQESIDKLLDLYTKCLLILTSASLLALLLCFSLDNADSHILPEFILSPLTIALSSVLSLFLLVYTCLIIYYEKLLLRFAYHSRRKLFPARSGWNSSEHVDDIFKWIGDLETVVERLIQNHRDNFHTSSDRSVLRSITSEEFECTYRDLISYRDFLRVEQQRITGLVSIGFWEYFNVRVAVRTLEERLREQFLQGERMQDQSFTAPFLFLSSRPLHLQYAVFTNAVFEKSRSFPRPDEPMGIDFHDAKLRGADFTLARLNYLNLENADCTEAVFTKAVLNQIQVNAGSCFQRAVFMNTDFGGQVLCAEGGIMCFKSASFDNALLTNCRFAWCDFRQAVFHQAVMSGVILDSICLSYANLNDTILTYASLTFCQSDAGRFDWKTYWLPTQLKENGQPLPAYTDFWNGRRLGSAFFVNLEKCVLSQACISDYNFTGSRMSNANFSDTLIKHCILDRCYGQKATFQEATLENCRFFFAMFNLADFSHAHIIDCDFHDCDLRDSLLIQTTAGKEEERSQGSRFYRANFSNAQVRECRFAHCVFTEALFENADLRGSVFKCCTFVNTSFLNTYLRGAVFQDCDLTGANFEGCDLNTCKRIRCTVDKAPKILRKRRNRHGG